MAVLALSFSGATASAALVDAGFGAEVETSRGAGGASPGALVQQLLMASGAPLPSALVVALGPGSYTGIRMAVSFAKSFALVRGLPLRAFTDHEALVALHAAEGEEVLVRHDGHGEREYWSRWLGAQPWPRRLTAEALGKPPPAAGLRVLGDRSGDAASARLAARDLAALALRPGAPTAELLLVEPVLPPGT